jgi:small subunit ribosomal protein S20
MPIIKSAKKALRGSLRKRVVNDRLKNNILQNTKKLKKLIADKKGKEAKEFFVTVQKALDKAVNKNYIKKGSASRKKSRLSAMIRKIS